MGISTITGKREPTFDEKVAPVLAIGHGLKNYIQNQYHNLAPWEGPPNKRYDSTIERRPTMEQLIEIKDILSPDDNTLEREEPQSRPTSAITGKPVPSFKEKMRPADAVSEGLGNYLAGVYYNFNPKAGPEMVYESAISRRPTIKQLGFAKRAILRDPEETEKAWDVVS